MLPHPSSDEDKNEWMNRCMSNDDMKRAHATNETRVGVCLGLWRDNKKEAEKLQDAYVSIIARLKAHTWSIRNEGMG